MIAFAATSVSVSAMNSLGLHSKAISMPSLHAANSASTGLLQVWRYICRRTTRARHARRQGPCQLPGSVLNSALKAPSTMSLFQPAGGFTFTHRSGGGLVAGPASLFTFFFFFTPLSRVRSILPWPTSPLGYCSSHKRELM